MPFMTWSGFQTKPILGRNMTVASVFEGRFNSIIREAVTKPLAPHGFRKRGHVFLRQLDELAWVVDIQRSRHNTSVETAFMVECGIYVPRVLNLYGGIAEPSSPTAMSCCIRVGIEMLVGGRVDGMWALHDPPHSAVEDTQIMGDVRRLITHHALPFLECLPSTLEVAQYLEPPPSEQRISPGTYAMALGCAGIIRLMRGEREAACAALARAVQDATGSHGEEHLRSLEQRLLSNGLV